MARPRKDFVRESLHDLMSLEERHRSTPLEARIRVVRLMKEEPARTIPQIAEKAGCSERSAHRWWKEYRRAGLDALLEDRKRERSGGRAGLDEAIDQLAAKLREEELTTLREIQEWLDREHGIGYTVKGVSNLLRDRLRVKRRWVFDDDEPAPRPATGHHPRAHASAPRLSEEVIRFLNELPMRNEIVDWILCFRDALRRFLGDVDYIVMAASVNADIDNQQPPITDLNLYVTRNVNLDKSRPGETLTTINRNDVPPSRFHLEDGVRAGFPLENYHPPHLFDYYVGTIHVGVIILFRERSAKPISSETVTVMEMLRPFLTFMMTDGIARQRKGIPPDRYFTEVLTEEANLTTREREVLTLHLFGAKYNEIAKQLYISVDTVRKHMKSIHVKTNTRTLSDLLARYFRPGAE